MTPDLKRLALKYQERMLTDPRFSCRVKMVYRLMRSIAPKDADPMQAKVAAYLFTCLLEETYDQNG